MGSKAEADYSLAWRTRVRGNVAPKHATTIIAQFVAACRGAAKGRGDCDADPNDGERGPPNAPDQKLALQRVHQILDTMPAELEDKGKQRARGEGDVGKRGGASPTTTSARRAVIVRSRAP